MPIVQLADGTPYQLADNPTAQDMAQLDEVNAMAARSMEMAAAMSRNPREGGGPMPKIPFSDSRVSAGPEAARVAAKSVYDATLGQAVGLGRLARMGLETGVGLVSPGTENKMREAREFDEQNNPFTSAGRAAEAFIQPRSSEGTRLANVAGAATGGGLLGKVGKVFSPAMGAGSGLAGAATGELYGVASQTGPNKWGNDPATDEPLGKLGLSVGVGALSAPAAKFLQAGLTGKYDKLHIARLAKEAGLSQAELTAIMQPGGILERARAQGIPLTTAQAIARENPLDAAQALAKDRLELGATRTRLSEQPGEVVAGLRNWIDNSVVGQGQQLPPQTLANQGRASANAFFDRLGDEATGAKLAGIAANAGPGVPQDVAEQFLSQARQYAAAHPGTRADKIVRTIEKAITNPAWAEEEKKLAEELRKMSKADKLLMKTGAVKPRTNPHPQFLSDEAQLRGALDSALAGFGQNLADTPAVAAELNKHAGYLRGLIADTISPHTPGVVAGKRAAEGILQESDRAKEQLVGALRGKTDTPAPLTSSLSNIFKQVDRGPVVGQHGELSGLRQALEEGTLYGLSKAQGTGKPSTDLSKTLFPDAARTHFEDILREASTGPGARPNTEAAEILVRDIGNRGKRQAMTQEIVQNTGDSLGLSSGTTALDRQKLADLMQIVGHTVERRGAGGLSAGQVLEKAAPKELSTISGFSLVAPLRFPFRWAHKQHEAASLKWLDKVLTTDEGRLDFIKQMNTPQEKVSRAALLNVLQTLSTQPQRLEEAEAAQMGKAGNGR